jgi:phosphate butyryltransferase
MIKSMNDLVERAQALETKTLVVAVANDHHVLEAVHKAKEANIIKPILVGDEASILETLEDLGIEKEGYEIVHIVSDVEACETAVKLVSQNDGYFLMKGYVDTAVILRAALDKDYGLRTKNRISHVTVMEVPNYHKLLMMTDGAMNIDPDAAIKQEIIENAIVIANAIGIDEPKIGILAAVEKINPKMQATLDAETLVAKNQKGEIKGCIIGGPFALDNAINKDAAETKGITDPIAGDVDMLLMPQIESGNMFYKSMMFLAGAKSASVIAGATKPIVLTSRADSTDSKFYSIALSALIADIKQ